MRKPICALAAAALGTTALAGPAAAVDETIRTEKAEIHVQTVAEGLDSPWGLAFLPEGDMLVTEKEGNLRLVSAEGDVSEPISGVPEVDARGQGGLLDVALDPSFGETRMVYLSFSEAGDGGNSTALARGTLSADATALENVEVIFSQQPKLPSTKHFGSRIVFDEEGRLFLGMGERSEARFREQSQDLGSHLGKVVRLNADGSVPEDNPFVGREGALPEIWSYGHRNIQGAALNPETGELWVNEHGPRGGDEINIAEAGKNYGWPVVSYGVNYDGSPVGSGEQTAEGMEDPIHQWTPVIAASGMEFYTADAIPGWQGSVFVGGMKTTELVRLEIDGNEVTHEERILTDLGQRIRAVKQGPDGALYVITDESDGQVMRLSAAGEAATGSTGQAR